MIELYNCCKLNPKAAKPFQIALKRPRFLMIDKLNYLFRINLPVIT